MVVRVTVVLLLAGCAVVPTPTGTSGTSGITAAPSTAGVAQCVPPTGSGGTIQSGAAAGGGRWGDGRIYLVEWPPATGVIEDDAIATVTGWPEALLGAHLNRLPDVDGDGCDELYAWAPGHSLVAWYDGFVLPVEAIAPGDQPTADFLVLRDTRIHGSVADVTGDGVGDLVQPFSANEFDASVSVFDGTTLGAAGGELRYDDGVARVVTEATSSSYGWPSGAIDLDGVPGDDLYVGWFDFGYDGLRARGRVDVYANASLDGSSVPTHEDTLANLAGRRTGEPWLAAAGALPDITGDGVPELFSTQPDTSFADVLETGEIAVVDGARLSAGGGFDYDDAHVRIGGEVVYERLGMVATGVEDLDGDGLGELLVGSGEASDGERIQIFRGSDLAAGGVMRSGDAAVVELGHGHPEVLPDLDGDAVPEFGAWGADGFVVWSGATVPVAVGGRFSDAVALGVPFTFRDRDLWGESAMGAGDDGIAVAFLRTPTGWLVAFGGSGAMAP